MTLRQVEEESIPLLTEELEEGVVLKISVTSSTNRNGELSWTATAIEKSHIESTVTHVGVIDSGGIQYLSNDRTAWFLEDVFPVLTEEITKCIVFEKSLSKKVKEQRNKMVPGALMMFQFERDRVTQAEIYISQSNIADVFYKVTNLASRILGV